MRSRCHWNTLERLPPKRGDNWCIWKDGHQVEMSVSEIESLVARWLPGNPLLIGAPGHSRFLPPVLIPEFEGAALRPVRDYYRRIGTALALFAFAMLTCAMYGFAVQDFTVTQPVSQAFMLGLSAALLAATFAGDYYFGLCSREGVAERALFYGWLKTDASARFGFWSGLVLVIGIGLLQVFLQWRLGSMDALFYRVGTMCPDIDAGQYWRLLTGPYLHYSIIHFATNAFLLLLAGTLAFALFGRSVLAVFLVSNICAALAQMLLGGTAFDNYGGISGGVYALWGMLIAAGALNHKLFPKGFWLMLVNTTVFGLFSAEALSVHTATVAHLCGLFIGIAIGVYYGRQSRALEMA